MSKLKLNKCNFVLLGLSWIAISTLTEGIAAKPVVSQNIVNNNDSKESNVALLSTSDRVSNKAIDLLSPLALSKYFTDIQTRTYQLAQQNLEKFCQDFPYNSKCTGTTPGVEPNSIPVPVPPPAPPEGSSDNSTSSSGQKSGWAIVPEISTLGLGGHVVKKIIPQVNARVGINAFSLGLDDAIDTDVDYEADLNLLNVSTLLDIHPIKRSGLRLSGGLIFGNNNFDGSADVSELVIEGLEEQEELNEEVIETLEGIDNLANVDAEVDVANGVSPYLGIGGGNAVAEGKGFGFWWNLGVVFSGSPDINLNTDLASEEVRASFEDSEFEEQVDRIIEETEDSLDDVVDGEEDDIQDSLDFVDIYPVLSLGISYQF